VGTGKMLKVVLHCLWKKYCVQTKGGNLLVSPIITAEPSTVMQQRIWEILFI